MLVYFSSAVEVLISDRDESSFFFCGAMESLMLVRVDMELRLSFSIDLLDLDRDLDLDLDLDGEVDVALPSFSSELPLLDRTSTSPVSSEMVT